MRKYSRVYLEITNICNRSCSFCPGTKRPPRRMTCKEFDILTDKLVGVTEYLYLHVMGEPLTHPDLIELIRIAKVKGFRVAITTNGTLIRRLADELISSGVYKVNISVHSFETGTDEEHVSYLTDLLTFADRASGAGVLTVFRLWNRGYDEGRNISVLSMLKEYFTEPWCEGERGARIRPKLHLEYGERFDWPSMDIEPLGQRVFCYGLGDHFAVLSDGSVVPCCLDKDGDVTLGNLFEESIDDILSSERAVSIHEGFCNKTAVEELCKRCGYARRFKL